MAKKAKVVFEKYRMVSGTVADFISNGWSEIEELGGEFREIYDNAPESLQQTDTNQRRDATASEIEGFNEPSVSNDVLGDIEATYQADNGKLYRGRISLSRSTRAANAAAQFQAAAEALRAWAEEHQEDDLGADELADECEELASNIEGLDWPGMFG